MPVTTDTLMQFLSIELGVDTSELTPSSPLFSSGLIDSFSLVTLLAHIEDACGIRIGATDVNLDNFDSLDRIAAYLGRTLGAKA